jgi:iron complex outermembrane receptor protein
MQRMSFDLALFYNDYDRLDSLEFGTPYIGPDGRTIIPIINQNLTTGHTSGGELLVEWSPLDFWHLTASFTHLDMTLTPQGADLNRNAWIEGSTPRNMGGLRSLLSLGQRFEIDALLRRQSRIHRIPAVVTGEGIPGYAELDLRLGWHLSENLELALVGQNLLHDEHVEFGPPASRGALERAAYVKATWRN